MPIRLTSPHTPRTAIAVTHFGERYKAKPNKLIDKAEKWVAPSIAAGGGSSASGLGILIGSQPHLAGNPNLCVLGHGLMLGGATAAGAATLSGLAIADQQKALRAQEPAMEKPEDLLRKAMENLDNERERHRNSVKGVKNILNTEADCLQSLQTKLSRLKNDGQQPHQSETNYALALAEAEQAVTYQEQTVRRMQENLTRLEQLERRFNDTINEKKRQYLELTGKLQKIEQNRKLLEMQQAMETLAGKTLKEDPTQSKALQQLQEALEADLHKSNGQVEDFLKEAAALSATENQSQREAIEKMRTQKP